MGNETAEKHDRREFSLDSPVSIGLVDALTTYHDTSQEDLPRLNKAIPCDALEELISKGDDVSVTFSYGDQRITVHDNRQLVIRDL